MHKLSLLCLIVFAFVFAGSREAAGVDQNWVFDVFLDDTPIGRQTFRVTETGGETRVFIEANLEVKFLFFTAYSYRHQNEERWRDGCLARISSTTDDNGTAFRLRGHAGEGGFMVATSESQRELEGCVRSFAYWRPEHLRAGRLLNSQTGDYEVVKLRDIGAETITAKGESRAAVRYALESEKFRIDLWYSTQDEWLGLESKSRGGRTLRYVLAN